MQIPNCVPEYYREIQEREEHEYELRQKQFEYYKGSRQRLEEAKEKGYPILYFGGYTNCWRCKKKFDVQLNEEDDMCALVCYDKTCAHHKKGDK